MTSGRRAQGGPEARGARDLYAFRTLWRVPASADRVWHELERTISGAAEPWWPGVHIEAPAARLEPGQAIGLVVRAPLGYRLRCTLRVRSVAERAWLIADSEGDLAGVGRIRVRPAGGGTEIRIWWDVRVQRPWMRALSPVLRPVFSAAHALVMRVGEHGLRRALRP